jgi:hypothetical protein
MPRDHHQHLDHYDDVGKSEGRHDSERDEESVHRIPMFSVIKPAESISADTTVRGQFSQLTGRNLLTAHAADHAHIVCNAKPYTTNIVSMAERRSLTSMGHAAHKIMANTTAFQRHSSLFDFDLPTSVKQIAESAAGAASLYPVVGVD